MNVGLVLRASLAVGTVALLAGCNSPTTGAAGDHGGTVSPSPTPAADVAFSVKDDARLEPDSDLRVTARQGQLQTVSLTGPDGKKVPGSVSRGVWSKTDEVNLVPDAEYTWTATAVNAEGKTTKEQTTFRTIRPRVSATYTVTPDESTVGVGMPVTVRFDSPVATPEMRAEVEKRMKIKVVPVQKGSWGWLDSTQLMWRPDSYWKAGTKVKVAALLTGVKTGDGKWITKDKGAEFEISKRARVTKVDLANHVMTVRDNGKTVASYPISAGKPIGTWETRSGVKVITEKHDTYTMDAGTLGLEDKDPNYYKTDVKYAMRVTNTGEFFHAAPWSVWAQGSRNVSHGCVNMSMGDAAEFYRSSIIGDVAEFVGSDRRMKPQDGMSAWVFTAEEWHARSAIAAPQSAPKA